MKNIEFYLGKKVKIISISKNIYIGTVIGIVPAHDNEQEIDEIDIYNELDERNYGILKSEIVDIKIIK